MSTMLNKPTIASKSIMYSVKILLLLLVLTSIASSQYQPRHGQAVPGSPCLASGTSCILRQLLSKGLVRGDHQARNVVTGEEGTDNLEEDAGEPSEQRSNRNSKYRNYNRNFEF